MHSVLCEYKAVEENIIIKVVLRKTQQCTGGATTSPPVDVSSVGHTGGFVFLYDGMRWSLAALILYILYYIYYIYTPIYNT